MTLTRRSSLSRGAQLTLRILILFALLGFVLLVHWIERDSLNDNLDGVVSFVDVIYFTMISATTTGYGDIVPVTDRARLFDALIVTPIRIFFILILAGTAYTFVIKRSWNNWLMKQIQRTLTGHIVVAGFGTSGSRTVEELIARGVDPRTIVVIDCDRAALDCAEALGCAVLQGDATRDATMDAVRVESASALIVSAGRDDTSILICLTARHNVRTLPITVAVRAIDNELPAKAAGATTVINPTSFAGLLLAGSAHGSGISDYLSDLASAAGQVRLSERLVSDAEVGTPLTDLTTGIGVRILRDGVPICFSNRDSQILQAGDRLIEIVPTTAKAN
ncbi:MAG: potassium channel family protein [Pseudomonadota bacterium]|nr:potassium channel family protein [Pseudomonadota bacterium]